MECDQYKAKLNPYLDAELSPEDSRGVESHLQACESCLAEMQAQRRLKRELRMAGKRYAPRLEFRRRLEAKIIPPQKSRWFTGWVPSLALASLALLVAFGGWNQLRHRQASPITAELTDMHTATLASANRVDVLSTDRHTVKPWFQGRIPFTFNLPELKDSGFTLLGGRVSYLQQQPAAHLLFEIRKHEISVFIQQDQPERNADFRVDENYNGFTIRGWKTAGLRYFLVTDASPQDADALVRLLKTTS
jgi:anti-sigma factor RsiW